MIVYIYAKANEEPLVEIYTIRASISRDAMSVELRNALQPSNVRVNNISYIPRAFQMERIS